MLKLVQVAWRHNLRGLAACMAVIWDGMLSPVDGRTLTLAQLKGDNPGPLFSLARAENWRSVRTKPGSCPTCGDLERSRRRWRRHTASTNNRLRKTYNPVNVPGVRRLDEARAEGTTRLERKQSESISTEPQEIRLGKTRIPRPLK